MSGKTGAIILAAGRSSRMGGVDKTTAELAGLPVAAHSLRAFAASPKIDAIVIVSGDDNHAGLVDLAERHGAGKVSAVVLGGARRRDSVAQGLAALPDVAFVAVHDAARPLVTPAIIARGVELAEEHGAALVVGAITDTIKQVAPGGAASVVSTIDRSTLRAAQTPQTFRREVLARAHAAHDDDATDDAALVEALGETVVVYEANRPNPKITRAEDLSVVEALLRATTTAGASS